jgi:hypothetical protein
VHRDLKPKNLMRRADGALLLIDFGSVKDALSDPQLGGSTVAGTFGYMAPEQFAGDACPRSDLYALGATAVALLARQEPRTLLEGGRLVWRDRVRVSAPTAALLEALLAVDPEDRPAGAGEVLRRIRALRAASREPPAIEAPPVAAPHRPMSSPSEHRDGGLSVQQVLAVLVGAFVILTVLVMVGRGSSACGSGSCLPAGAFTLRGLHLGHPQRSGGGVPGSWQGQCRDRSTACRARSSWCAPRSPGRRRSASCGSSSTAGCRACPASSTPAMRPCVRWRIASPPS